MPSGLEKSGIQQLKPKIEEWRSRNDRVRPEPEHSAFSRFRGIGSGCLDLRLSLILVLSIAVFVLVLAGVLSNRLRPLN